MKKKTVIIAGVGVVTAAAVATTIWFATRPASAEDAAAAYVDALASGDAAAVQQLLSDPSSYGDTAYEALGQASAFIAPGPITVNSDDTAAHASLDVTLADDTYLLTFGLVHDSTGWKIEPAPAGEIVLSVDHASGAQIGDSRLDLGDENALALGLLPAQYTVTATPTEYVAGESTVVAGLASDDQTVTVTGSLRPEAEGDIATAIDEHLNDCVAGASSVPTDCGFIVPWAADLARVSAVSYRVDREPTVAIDVEAGTFHSESGALVASVTGLTRSGAEETFSYRTDAWSPRGSLDVDRDGLVIQVY